MVVPGPLTRDALGRPCAIDLPKVIIDGLQRDRCPYVGDEAVIGMTLLDSTPSDVPVLRSMILWFAQAQRPDGAIPASPLDHRTKILIDYNAYWVEDLYDYVLYTGDLSLARETWPALVRLLDRWYPAHTTANGLLVNDLGPADYAYIQRPGRTVAYYNAGYVRALRRAAAIAGWLGEPGVAERWRKRILAISHRFSAAFWDAHVGAFRDATTGPVDHPQDGNAFAILAGLATRRQAVSALDYLDMANKRSYGNTVTDTNVWDTPRWGHDAAERVYPFISYFEVLARFSAGLDASATDLLRREWGYMAHNGPKSTMWETIGPFGGPPVDQRPSYDSGWSSGAAPALTQYLLGVAPASLGFRTIRLQPHPADVLLAKGTVPTPRGTIRVSWRWTPAAFTETFSVPTAGTIYVPYAGVASLDGKHVASRKGTTSARFGPGHHELIVRF
jgi:hypothetical protein